MADEEHTDGEDRRAEFSLDLGLPRGVPEVRAVAPPPAPAASMRLRDELSLYLPPR